MDLGSVSQEFLRIKAQLVKDVLQALDFESASRAKTNAALKSGIIGDPLRQFRRHIQALRLKPPCSPKPVGGRLPTPLFMLFPVRNNQLIPAKSLTAQDLPFKLCLLRGP
jgi:hypothetical protein